MKQSHVKPGVRAWYRNLAVLVRYQVTPRGPRDVRWVCLHESSGREFEATPRQLQPIRGLGLVCAVDHSAYARMAESDRRLAVTSSEPGQTIDAGDVVITTTLHRLG